MENWIDSEIQISTIPEVEFNNIILEHPRNLQITFEQKGREKNLSIYLDSID